MLRFLCQHVEQYQRPHALHPNVPYMSPRHHQKLREWLPEIKSQEELCRFLMMSIVISPEALHPYVARLPSHGDVNPARVPEPIL